MGLYVKRTRRDTSLRTGRLALGILGSRLLGRHRPLAVNLELSHRCNLRCVFCDKGAPEAPQMETGAALTLIRALAGAGTLSICLDGGEPLLHPGLAEIIAQARRHKLRVAISTNGTLLAERLEVLREVDALKISIDGGEETHDLVRGKGNHRRALAGAQAAVAAGVPVALRMTIGDRNFSEVPAVIALAREIGATALFQPAIGSLFDSRAARGARSCDPAPYREVMRAVIAQKRAGAPVGNEFVCLAHLLRWPDPAPVPFCAGGRIQAAIGPEGNLYPCGRVYRREPAPNVFALGVGEAFRRLARPVDCANCWCTLTLGYCYLYRLDPRCLEGHLGWGASRG